MMHWLVLVLPNFTLQHSVNHYTWCSTYGLEKGELHCKSVFITEVYIHQFTLRSNQVASIQWVAGTYRVTEVTLCLSDWLQAHLCWVVLFPYRLTERQWAQSSTPVHWQYPYLSCCCCQTLNWKDQRKYLVETCLLKLHSPKLSNCDDLFAVCCSLGVYTYVIRMHTQVTEWD